MTQPPRRSGHATRRSRARGPRSRARLPPPALDQAILAAAHRAVNAGPRDATEAAPLARRPQRWWMPLAAAAVIGVVAIGVDPGGAGDANSSRRTRSSSRRSERADGDDVRARNRMRAKPDASRDA